MHLGSFLTSGSRVIDVGTRSADLAKELAAAGHRRYLGLVPAAHLERVREEAGDLAPRFHALHSAGQVLHCSTDVLVLRAGFAELSWAMRELLHLRLLAVEDPGMHPARALALWRARRDVRTRTLGRSDGALRSTVLAMPGRPRRGPRRYLSPTVGIDGLSSRLHDEGLRYAVLRWFDELPHVSPEEDVDVLVADGDLERLRAILREEPGTMPVDLYSETGADGADFRRAAYFPPSLAHRLLARTVVHTSGLLVPNPEDHLHSLAYHALYHKGYSSGLPSSYSRPGPTPDHDYVGTIAKLADTLDRRPGSTLEEVDGYLAAQGWRPPADTLRRLARDNRWLADHVGPPRSRRPDAPVQVPSLAVFMVRERTCDYVDLDQLVRSLEHFGFEPLVVHELDAAQRERCGKGVRGGNWGAGPFPTSGGGPVYAVATAHYTPERPGPRALDEYPRLENYETVRAKEAIRARLARVVPADERFNPVHSSDEEEEAWEYAELAMPRETVASLRTMIAERRAAWAPGPEVVSTLSRGRRAKVEVVRSPSGELVRKTYPPGFVRFRDREVEAMRRLAGAVPEVPVVVDEGPTWFAVTRFGDDLPELKPGPGHRLVPLRVMRQMVGVLRRIYDLGYDLVDAKPQNFVRDPVEGLKVVDFEFLHEYGDTRPAFVDSFNFVGVPEEFEGDVPASRSGYEWRWQRFTGVPRRVLTSGSPMVQTLHRTRFRLRRATVAWDAPPRRTAFVLLRRSARLYHRARWSGVRLARRRAERVVAAHRGVR